MTITVRMFVVALAIAASSCWATCVTTENSFTAMATPVFPEAAASEWQPRLFPGDRVVVLMPAQAEPERVGIPTHTFWLHGKEIRPVLDKYDMVTNYSVTGVCVEDYAAYLDLGPQVGTGWLVITAFVRDNPKLCWVQVVKLEVRREPLDPDATRPPTQRRKPWDPDTTRPPIRPGEEFPDERNIPEAPRPPWDPDSKPLPIPGEPGFGH